MKNASVHEVPFKLSPWLASAIAAALLAGAAWYLTRPAERQVRLADPLNASQCKQLFDAIVSDLIDNAEEDERVACRSHFAGWVKSVQPTKYKVVGANLEIRGTQLGLSGSQAWRTSYAVGDETLPAVLVVTSSTAATLRFQNASEAEDAVKHLVGAGAVLQ